MRYLRDLFLRTEAAIVEDVVGGDALTTDTPSMEIYEGVVASVP